MRACALCHTLYKKTRCPICAEADKMQPGFRAALESIRVMGNPHAVFISPHTCLPKELRDQTPKEAVEDLMMDLRAHEAKVPKVGE